jgi:hypothetical protein
MIAGTLEVAARELRPLSALDANRFARDIFSAHGGRFVRR